jgi:hypothetical protein
MLPKGGREGQPRNPSSKRMTMKYFCRESFATSEGYKVLAALCVFVYGDIRHEMDWAIGVLLVFIYAELLTIVRNTKKNES